VERGFEDYQAVRGLTHERGRKEGEKIRQKRIRLQVHCKSYTNKDNKEMLISLKILF
jgi:hypothetical protein